MRLFVIRHGQTAWNLEQRNQGHIDIPLDAVGQRQSAELAAHFESDEPLEAVYTSDLLRALETARPLAARLGVALIVDARLRERKFGEWEGQLISQFAHLQTECQLHGVPLADFHPPGGESLQDLWDRLAPMAEQLVALRGSAAVVTHGGSGSMLLGLIARGTALTARSFQMDNASVTEMIRRNDGLFRLGRYNDTGHLAGGVD